MRRLLEKMLLGGAKIYSDFPVKRKVTIISLAYAGIFMQKIIANTPFFRERCAKEPTFLIRKVGKRISHRTHHFILVKLLKFQKLFSKSFLRQGLGRKPRLIMRAKKHGVAVLFYIVVKSWNCVPNFASRGFLKKPIENPQKFPTEHTTLFLAKLLKIRKKLFSKSFLRQGLGRTAPTDNARKKARRCRAFLYSIKIMNPCRHRRRLSFLYMLLRLVGGVCRIL